jgi:hypothetical protein
VLAAFNHIGATLTGFLVVFAISVLARLISMYYLGRMHDPQRDFPIECAAIFAGLWHSLKFLKGSQFLRFTVFYASMQGAGAGFLFGMGVRAGRRIRRLDIRPAARGVYLLAVAAQGEAGSPAIRQRSDLSRNPHSRAVEAGVRHRGGAGQSAIEMQTVPVRLAR